MMPALVKEPITADSLVCEVIKDHPGTVTVFVRHGFQCVGCYIAPFHTIADSAREHAITLETLLDDLNQAASGAHDQGSVAQGF